MPFLFLFQESIIFERHKSFIRRSYALIPFTSTSMSTQYKLISHFVYPPSGDLRIKKRSPSFFCILLFTLSNAGCIKKIAFQLAKIDLCVFKIIHSEGGRGRGGGRVREEKWLKL